LFSNLLDLTETTDGQYRAPPPPDKGERIFGGQFLAQSMRAAELTVPDDRQVHSLHAYFLRPGDVDHPIELKVDTVRDGRTFSARQVIAHQHDKERFRVTLSFHVNDYCPEFIGATMPDVPSPEEVSFTYDDFTLELIDDDEWPGSARPLEIRYINPPRIRGEATSAPQLMWMRIAETLGDAPGEHLAGLAYLSDSTLVDHIRLPHGKRWQDDDFEGASLDHAMWFHRASRADQWLLFEQSVQSTGLGRGLVLGRFFDRTGQIVASCMQEGLMRW